MLRIACLLLAAVAPLCACLNDEATPKDESEFRSRYRDGTAPRPAEAAPPMPIRAAGLSLAGAGVAALVAAGWWLTRRRGDG